MYSGHVLPVYAYAVSTATRSVGGLVMRKLLQSESGRPVGVALPLVVTFPLRGTRIEAHWSGTPFLSGIGQGGGDGRSGLLVLPHAISVGNESVYRAGGMFLTPPPADANPSLAAINGDVALSK